MFTKTKLCALAASALFCAQGYAAPIDLNTWSQAGPAGNGNWVVDGSGDSVLQTINGQPTMFISPDTLINDNIQGDIQVTTTSDDDYIGFVFGFQSVNDFYLFDWKQGDQSGSLAGFTLAHVTGGLDSIPFSNHQTSAAGYNVLDTNTGTGWADLTSYTFNIGYNGTSIDVSVAGGVFGSLTSVLSTAGTFAEGQYGFFNYSQAQVLYAGFIDQAPPPSVPEPGILTLLGLGLAGIGLARRRKNV